MALLILFAIAAQGCTALLISDRSEMELSTSKNPTQLSLESVTIKIIPKNGKVFGVVGPVVPIIPFWYSEAKDHFWFLVSLSPEAGEISFDPKQVALETEQGDRFFAKGFSGPLLVSHIVQNDSDPHKTLFDPKNLNASLNPFSVYAPILMGLMFDIKTFDPDRPFRLSMTGLGMHGHPILVPVLKFKKERRRHLDFLFFEPLNFHKEWMVEPG